MTPDHRHWNRRRTDCFICAAASDLATTQTLLLYFLFFFTTNLWLENGCSLPTHSDLKSELYAWLSVR